jgi:outer membrane protein TolC
MMRPRRVALIMVVAGLTSGRARAAPLDLDSAIKLAESRNERAKIADLNVVVADAGVEKARAAFLPALVANGNDAFHAAAGTNVATTTLTFNQPLLAPSAFPLFSQAKHLLASQRAQSTDDKRLLAFDTAHAYFAVLLADGVVQAAQRKLDTAKTNLADTNTQFKAQIVSSNDVTRAQIDLASSERELASDQGSLEAAYLQLAFVINAPVEPGLAEPTAVITASQKEIKDVDALVKLALARRPDVAAKRDAALAAHDFAHEPLMRLIPTIGLNASFNASSNATMGRNTDEVVTLTATWNIFDAGTRYADKRSRDASAQIADLNAATLERSIDSQVRTAAALLASAQASLVAAKDAMDAARASAVETEVLYRRDLAKAIELVDANQQRFLAEVNYASAVDSVAQAYLALRQTVGLEPTGTDL